MEIEKQVCSLEQAKKLKELGIVYNNPVLTWNCIMPDPTGEKYFYDVLFSDQDPGTLHEFICAAYTSAEIGAMLNDLVGLVCFHGDRWHPSHDLPECKTEAEAKAALLIYFLESEDDYVNAKVCNERLSS